MLLSMVKLPLQTGVKRPDGICTSQLSLKIHASAIFEDSMVPTGCAMVDQHRKPQLCLGQGG